MRHILLVLLGMAVTSGWALAQVDFERIRAYGEHLAQECVACHRTDGGPDPGIRSIIGWQSPIFINTMKAYRNEEYAERRNQVMVSVARSLNEEELEALATYFGALQPQ